jgi:1,2-diacylglycerol 3-alpha-glucosyltransferase
MPKKPTVFLVCTGLGRVNRGYESFTRECFEALKDSHDFKVCLFKGGGEAKEDEFVVPNLSRETRWVTWFSRIFKIQAYVVEQFTFCFFMIPAIVFKRPKLIYYSDFNFGTYLWHIRKMFKLNFKLLLANGAAYGPPYKTEDHVQQLLPVFITEAINKGEPASKQTLLPYGFDIDLNDRIGSRDPSTAKSCIGISPQLKVILSVGAINKSQKRMHYIIEEFSLLSEEFFLVIIGHFDTETAAILKLADKKIPGRFLISTAAPDQMHQYYRAADYFILGSLYEGFGRVLIEALSYGLHCIVHDYVNARQVLKEYGYYINMQEHGALLRLLRTDGFHWECETLIRAAYQVYSWDNLKYDYSKMIKKLIV